MRNFSEDFINVKLNDKKISLFNSHKHKILDVLILEEIKSNMLIGKHGKNIRFYINGKKRIAFGERGENAKIFLNGNEVNIDSKIKDNDKIMINFASKGKDAKEKVTSYIDEKKIITVYFENEIKEIEPIIFVNGKKEERDYIIKDEDNIEIIYPTKIKEFKKYILNLEEQLYVNNSEVNEEYILSNDDNISTKLKDRNKIEVKVNGNNVIFRREKRIYICRFTFVYRI